MKRGHKILLPSLPQHVDNLLEVFPAEGSKDITSESLEEIANDLLSHLEQLRK